MNKRIAYSVLVVLMVCGCQNRELDVVVPGSKSFTATIEDGFQGGATKTSLDAEGNVLWKQGDRVSIFAGSTANELYQVTDESDGKTSASLNRVSGSSVVSGTEIDDNVALYPYSSSAVVSKDGGSYVISGFDLPSVQNYTVASFGCGAFPMAAVTSSTSDLNLRFKNVLGGLKLQFKGTGKIISVSIRGNNNEILCGAAEVTVSHGSIPSINLTDASAKTVTLDCGEGVQLDEETATTFIIALPPMTMEGGFTVIVTDSAGKQMEIKTTKSQIVDRSHLLRMPVVTYEGAVPVFEYVDLGLPSGIKWATFNLGATKPEESGDYYQWAGIQDVTSTSIYVSLNNCPYHTGYSSSDSWSKYIPTDKSSYWNGIGDPDNLDVLDEYDDAAQRIIGGKWRMPTVGEYLDLMDKCTMTWTDDYNSTGVRGYIFTSKMAGYTDKSIFLPVAGYRVYSSISSSQTGYYWTSTLYTYEPSKAAYFYFSSSSHECAGFYRYYGNLIRPVYDEDYHEHSLVLVPGQNPTETSPGWKACYRCSACGKYMEEGHKPIGDETAYLAWKSKGGNGYLELPSAVDLGLSVKWASCNVGADNAYSFGDYYAWGETTAKTDYSASTYQYGRSPSFTKYCTRLGYGIIDNKVVLDLEDDAAYVNWGGNWRMPTEEEIKELNNTSNCSWTKYEVGNTEFNGVAGYKVQSLIPGYTDNYIFIPFAGHINGQAFESSSGFWSSSLYPSIMTSSTRGGDGSWGIASRYLGYSVRPVYSDNPNCGITGISLDRSQLTLWENDSFKLTSSVAKNSGAVNTMVEWSSSNPSVASVDYNGVVSAVSIGVATITAKTHFGGFTATCNVTVTAAPEPEYVDLGLSVKWATFNLGAAKPSGYGKYYAWGETKAYGEDDPSNVNNYSYTSSYTKYNYSWRTYKWFDYPTSMVTKYCTNSVTGVVDNRIILEKEDDAAYVNWGENWRMPTSDEMAELSNSDNCSWTWYDETNTEFDGVRGYKVQSLKPGYTDKYIFLPISRVHRLDTDSSQGCGYWTSSLYQYNWGASVKRISAYSTTDWGYIEDNDSSYGRYNGYNIRPVYSEDAAGGVTGVSLDKTELTMYLGEIVKLNVAVSTVDGGVNKAVVWSTTDPSVTSIEGYYYYSCNVTALTVGTSTVTVRTALGGFEATCTINVVAPPEIDADYVDLGLPSGTLWAAYNIGATAPEEYGSFFAWGETAARTGFYGWSDYKFSNGSSSSITKYKSNNAVLDAIDDAAYLNWGTHWRMPTRQDWNELLTNCTWTWTTQNGVNGYLVTSNTNSNSIFLPAAGYRGSNLKEQGTTGFYWTSTLAYSSTAYYVQFSSGSAEMKSNLYRYSGLQVRAVRNQ